MALSSLNAYAPYLICKASFDGRNNGTHTLDAAYIRRAAEVADKSAGLTSPHPNFGCVIATTPGNVVGEGFLYAQGTKPAEVQAVEAAGEHCRGATAYLNMESGDCHGDHTAVSALIQVCLLYTFYGFFRFYSCLINLTLVFFSLLVHK